MPRARAAARFFKKQLQMHIKNSNIYLYIVSYTQARRLCACRALRPFFPARRGPRIGKDW